jgi:thiamine pyrophosphokinase
MSSNTIIIANGKFPEHEIPLGYLKSAGRIICCDGSTKNLIDAGYIPDAIVGDMDSISDDLAERFRDRLFKDENQETNDLTKAVNWCKERGYRDLVIIGATGRREDHTIGNISLLTEYIKNGLSVAMVTDTGFFLPYLNNAEVSSFPGQQVSVFCSDPGTEITSKGLRYKLNNAKLKNWWFATLNETIGDHFELEVTGGPIILFLKFRD